jgi:hypothetical protein
MISLILSNVNGSHLKTERWHPSVKPILPHPKDIFCCAIRHILRCKEDLEMNIVEKPDKAFMSEADA